MAKWRNGFTLTGIAAVGILPREESTPIRLLLAHAQVTLSLAMGKTHASLETKATFSMSTTTPRPDIAQADTGAVPSTVGHTLQGWFLILMVFVAGACSLAIELTASRLLAPYFGTSLFVWANLIGLILLYLSIGYYVGGRLADRYPRPAVLYSLTTIAALLIACIPVISGAILTWALTVFSNLALGVFYGSLIAVMLLFALPMILLGCVSPYAIRLRITQSGKAGRTAGQLYAISTAGSIVGTFLPVLVLMPDIGTRLTFFVFALALLVMSLIGLLTSGAGKEQPSKNGGLSR